MFEKTNIYRLEKIIKYLKVKYVCWNALKLLQKKKKGVCVGRDIDGGEKGKVQTKIEAGRWMCGTIALFYFCMCEHFYNEEGNCKNKTLFLEPLWSAGC